MSEPSTSVGKGRARGYSWAPFAPGHTLSTRHGAHSERHLRPIVDELLGELHRLAPWCSSPVFAATVEAWAWAEARAVTYRRHFDEHGMAVGAEEQPRGLESWDRAERRAANLRQELGLSPSSLTKLLSGLSQIDGPSAQAGLEALKATGAAIRQAADRAALGAGEPSDGGDHGGGDAGGEELGDHGEDEGDRVDGVTPGGAG